MLRDRHGLRLSPAGCVYRAADGAAHPGRFAAYLVDVSGFQKGRPGRSGHHPGRLTGARPEAWAQYADSAGGLRQSLDVPALARSVVLNARNPTLTDGALMAAALAIRAMTVREGFLGASLGQ